MYLILLCSPFFLSLPHIVVTLFTELIPQKWRNTVTGTADHALFQGEEQSEHFQ